MERRGKDKSKERRREKKKEQEEEKKKTKEDEEKESAFLRGGKSLNLTKKKCAQPNLRESS